MDVQAVLNASNPAFKGFDFVHLPRTGEVKPGYVMFNSAESLISCSLAFIQSGNICLNFSQDLNHEVFNFIVSGLTLAGKQAFVFSEKENKVLS